MNERAEKAVGEGATGVIMAALRAHVAVAGVQAEGCRALERICWGCGPKCKRRMHYAARAGALPVIVDAMQTHLAVGRERDRLALRFFGFVFWLFRLLVPTFSPVSSSTLRVRVVIGHPLCGACAPRPSRTPHRSDYSQWVQFEARRRFSPRRCIVCRPLACYPCEPRAPRLLTPAQKCGVDVLFLCLQSGTTLRGAYNERCDER